jgi:chromosome segregation ATPase
LRGKLEQLHLRLEEKERELAIRALKYRDVDEETIRLQEKISQNSDEALDTASSLNRAKFKLSSIERAMLAVVSELAMYRALTATLANAKSRNIAEIDALRLTLEAKET